MGDQISRNDGGRPSHPDPTVHVNGIPCLDGVMDESNTRLEVFEGRRFAVAGG